MWAPLSAELSFFPALFQGVAHAGLELMLPVGLVIGCVLPQSSHSSVKKGTLFHIVCIPNT